MKFTLSLFAVLAIIGLGQAHQFPDFGNGPLHDDIQDVLDLIPVTKISEVVLEYVQHDPEVQAALQILSSTTLLKDLVVDFEAIPEVINLMNYLQKEGIEIYYLVNKINKRLEIKELVPPSYNVHSIGPKRTGGIAGLFKDIKVLFSYDEFIRIYVKKMKTSAAFVDFVNELKSDNFQQLVNKAYKIPACQTILTFLKNSGVNTQIVGDVLFVVLGISVPESAHFYAYTYAEHTMSPIEEELMDFWDLLPTEKYAEIVLDYLHYDKKVQDAFLYMFTPEFHDLLRTIEALKEHQALVIYLQNTGLDVFDLIQSLHDAIGMEDYVPPKIENIIKSEIGVHKVGEGMKAMFEDLYNLLPLDEIDALYKEKLQNSKVFSDFIEKLKSPNMQTLIDNLYSHNTYKEFVMTTRGKGLELQEMTKLVTRIMGIQFPY